MLPRESSTRNASRTRSRTSRSRTTGLRSRNNSIPRRGSFSQESEAGSRIKELFFIKYYHSAIHLIEAAKQMALNPTLWRSVLRGSVFFLVAVNLYATAWGTYATFYAHYLPVITNSEPVYFNYGNGAPLATIMAHKDAKPKFFSYGQAYDVFLELDVPESETNLIQGNFMVRLELKSSKGNKILVSERPALVKYRSSLLRKFMTMVYSIPLVLDMQSEKQTLTILLTENFWEDYDDVVSTVSIGLSNPLIQTYSSRLLVKAHLYGLKYFMYQWPTLAATIITTLFFMGELIFALLVWQGVIYFWGQLSATNSTPDSPPSPPQAVLSESLHEASTPSESQHVPLSPTINQLTAEEEEWERLSATYHSGGALTPPSFRPLGVGSSQPLSSQAPDLVDSASNSLNEPESSFQPGQFFGQLDDADIQSFDPNHLESDQRSGTLFESHEASLQNKHNQASKDGALSSRFSDSSASFAGPSRLPKNDSKDKDL